MNAETLKGHLDLLLLAALQSRPAHGYAIADTLRARSDGAFDSSRRHPLSGVASARRRRAAVESVVGGWRAPPEGLSADREGAALTCEAPERVARLQPSGSCGRSGSI